MSKKPTISVVIPLYNKGAYIRRTLDSVLVQTFTDFEVIVVNDGSTDDSLKNVYEVKDCRVRIISQANAGESAARNKGIAEAQGELIAFLDADDEWLPNFLETIFGLVGRFPAAGAYATGYRLLKSGEHIYHSINVGCKREKCGCYFDLSRKRSVINSSNVTVRRSIFDKVGGFRVGYKLGGDWDMWFRIGLHYEFACSPKICSLYYYDLPDNVCHTVTPGGVYPIEISFSDMKKDVNISPSVKSKAIKYASFRMAKQIKVLFFKDFRDIGRRRFLEYRETFGINSSYIKLLLFSIVPLPWIRFIAKIRLKFIRGLLTVRSIMLK